MPTDGSSYETTDALASLGELRTLTTDLGRHEAQISKLYGTAISQERWLIGRFYSYQNRRSRRLALGEKNTTGRTWRNDSQTAEYPKWYRGGFGYGKKGHTGITKVWKRYENAMWWWRVSADTRLWFIIALLTSGKVEELRRKHNLPALSPVIGDRDEECARYLQTRLNDRRRIPSH